jgi:thiamine biosynthesis protein ThiI
MHPPGADTIVVRYGEIGLKSGQVRVRMVSQLRQNVAAVLADRGFQTEIEQAHSGLYIHTDDQVESVTDAITDVFGVVSASPATRVEPTMEAICAGIEPVADAHYDSGTFAVRANRAGPASAHPFPSTDIERQGGSAVWEIAERNGVDPAVDLDDPGLTVSVDCREDDAFIFLDKQAGPGGLPVGTQEPLVALVSGGIDSPVAAWDAMKRGCPIYPLYIDLGEYGGVDHRLRAEETARTLGSYAPNFDMTLRVAPENGWVDSVATETESLRMLVLRRVMFRIAATVAEAVEACGIVTGESIGQKSSQTSTNLRATSAVTDVPIHRPLLNEDKTAITERAKEIGTYEDAKIEAGCNRLAPDSPATRARPDVVADVEPEQLAELAREAAEAVEIIE